MEVHKDWCLWTVVRNASSILVERGNENGKSGTETRRSMNEK